MDGIEPMHEEWEQGEGGEDDDTGDPPRIWLRHKALPGCAFTRSIGDAVGEQVGVFARPEVLVKDLTENDKYVLIASDGVWGSSQSDRYQDGRLVQIAAQGVQGRSE